MLGVAIVTRATTAESPWLAAGKACADEAVRRLAELHAERLVNGTQCYATKGTGLVKPLRDLLKIVVPDPAIAPAPENPAPVAPPQNPVAPPR